MARHQVSESELDVYFAKPRYKACTWAYVLNGVTKYDAPKPYNANRQRGLMTLFEPGGGAAPPRGRLGKR
eukprot:5748214-Pyramimonas_sp.AAC.1